MYFVTREEDFSCVNFCLHIFYEFSPLKLFKLCYCFSEMLKYIYNFVDDGTEAVKLTIYCKFIWLKMLFSVILDFLSAYSKAMS